MIKRFQENTEDKDRYENNSIDTHESSSFIEQNNNKTDQTTNELGNIELIEHKTRIIIYSDLNYEVISNNTNVLVIKLEDFQTNFFSIDEIFLRAPLGYYGQASKDFIHKYEPLLQYWFRSIICIDYDLFVNLTSIIDDNNSEEEKQGITTISSDNISEDTNLSSPENEPVNRFESIIKERGLL